MTDSGLAELNNFLSAELEGMVEPPVTAIADLAKARYGDQSAAVLFYGSCLRRGYRDDDVVDLYLIVDRYKHETVSCPAAVLNWLLPPNVIYLETDFAGKTVRAKCAIISLTDFERGVSGRWFHSYMWARFAQPSRLAYAREKSVVERIVRAVEGATKTMARETLPLLRSSFDAETLWSRALTETYRAELRSEKPERAREIVRGDHGRYAKLAELLCRAGILQADFEVASPSLLYRAGASGRRNLSANVKWILRRILGKTLSVLRLVKAAFTFDNGAIYILWKIERHSGVTVDLSDWQRRHPILASTTLFWRLYRKGAFK